MVEIKYLFNESVQNHVNYKKEYPNLFSSNNHEQAYRSRGCYFNCPPNH